MKCKVCGNVCNKNGFQTNGKQRYFCGLCKKSQQKLYNYNAYYKNTNKRIYTLLINSCGINDISRILRIAPNTVKKRILFIAKHIKTPVFYEHQQSYQADEMQVKVKELPINCWVSYAINKKTKTVVNFHVGRRRSIDLASVINKVLILNPKHIYTDKWISYVKIVPENLHRAGKSLTNHIERLHLNLRTHLKCLSRKTMCYCKRLKTLEAILKIYFWGYTLNFKQVQT